MLNKDYLSFATEVLIIIRTVDEANQARDPAKATAFAKIVHHITVLSTIATAQSTDEARQAMDAIVAKPGTYREIRHTDGPYLLVQSYLGAAVGREEVRDADVDTATYVAPFIPLGIEGRWTWWGENRYWPTGLGLLLAPVDLGNVASRRLDDDDTERDTEWKDVWAPGVFVTVPMGYKLPLTLGAGAQFSPALRVDPVSGEPRDVIRFTAFVAWEVPLYTF